MNIAVINISLRPQSPIKLFPVGLGFITTAMKSTGFDFHLIDIDAYRFSDEELEQHIKRNKYDVICMGCIVTGYKIVKKIASLIKKYYPNSIIIVGNSVATSIVKILLSKTQVDIAVMAEGDETIVELLLAISKSQPIEDVKGICFAKEDKIICTEPRPLIRDISSLPIIDYSIFDVDIYIDNSKYEVSEPLPIPRSKIRALPVNTARGCIFTCGFCYHVFRGLPYRYRTPESIIKEVKMLIKKYSINYIHFWDELTFFSKKQTLKIVNKILKENIHFYWTAQCIANLFKRNKDIDIIKKMKDAGCIGIEYSLESADSAILKAMNKRISAEQFSRQTQLFQKVGITTWTSLVFGYPQETPDTIQKTFDCCVKNNIYPSVGFLLPQPGSQIYEYAKNKGYIKDEEDYLMKMGDRQDLILNMTKMKDDDFEAIVLEGLKRCNEELDIGLKDDNLIKTQYYRAPQDTLKRKKEQ